MAAFWALNRPPGARTQSDEVGRRVCRGSASRRPSRRLGRRAIRRPRPRRRAEIAREVHRPSSAAARRCANPSNGFEFETDLRHEGSEFSACASLRRDALARFSAATISVLFLLAAERVTKTCVLQVRRDAHARHVTVARRDRRLASSPAPGCRCACGGFPPRRSSGRWSRASRWLPAGLGRKPRPIGGGLGSARPPRCRRLDRVAFADVPQ